MYKRQAPEATVSAGPADYVLNSDTDVSQLGRRQPQIVELEQPARARYIRVYGRGHLGGWGNYSARMSYGEIRALKAPDPQWDELNGLVAQARQAAGGELDPEPVSYTHLDVYKRQAERISAGRMITWVDPAFSKLDPWALSKEYAANILGGSSVETAVKDMNTAVANAIKLA